MKREERLRKLYRFIYNIFTNNNSKNISPSQVRSRYLQRKSEEVNTEQAFSRLARSTLGLIIVSRQADCRQVHIYLGTINPYTRK